MFNDFDPFDNSGDDGSSLHHDNGQQDYSMNNDNSIFNDDFSSHSILNTEDIGGLTPSDSELYHLEKLEEQNIPPEQHENNEAHEKHHDISFGESTSCSDCSGSCAAYCASIFK